MNFLWKNQIPYLESLKMQEKLKSRCLERRENFILGFECPAVVTLGLRGGEEDLLLSHKEYRDRGISIEKITRGGQATLHSLGQLVIYPVMDIRACKMRVRDFILKIENITQEVFLKFNVETHKEEGEAGLFTEKGKIAFFGVHVSEGVSQHGLAINVSNDLNLFSLIKSCGKEGRQHDRLVNYCVGVTVQQVFDVWTETAIKMGLAGQDEFLKKRTVNAL